MRISLFVKAVDVFVEKREGKGEIGEELRPSALDVLQCTPDVFGLYPDHQVQAGAVKEHERFDGKVQRPEVKIPHHADHRMCRTIGEQDLPADGLLGRFPAQDAHRRLVDHDVFPLRVVSV